MTSLEIRESKKAYEEGLELNPNDALIHIGLAHMCLDVV
jgi:hypothetical protein